MALNKTDKTQETFDKYASEYDAVQSESMGFLGKDVSSFARYKVELVKELLPETPERILEFGCGTGRNLPFFCRAFPNSEIHACDISEESLKIAYKIVPEVKFFASNDIDIFSQYQEKFDLVFLAGVLHHIPHDEHEKWINALKSTLREDGNLIVFEHNPYNPVTRHLVNSCPYDEDARLISLSKCKEMLIKNGFSVKRSGYTLLFPWRKKFFVSVEKLFKHFPFGGQYYVVARKPCVKICLWGIYNMEVKAD